MQDYRDGFMSVLFIECAALHREFSDFPRCCEECHSARNERTHKIYVRPIGQDGLNADWYLCVEAIVCCSLYHRVRALPYEWWVEKAEKAGVRRDDMRGYKYTDSTHLNTERPHVEAKKETPSIKAYKKARAIAEVKDAREREESSGLGAWLKR